MVINWDNLRATKTLQHRPRPNLVVRKYQYNTLLGKSEYKLILRSTLESGPEMSQEFQGVDVGEIAGSMGLN